jgi:hypothetical protein
MCDQLWAMLHSNDTNDCNFAMGIIRQRFLDHIGENLELLLCIQNHIQHDMHLGNASRELIELELEIYELLN